MQDDCPTSDQLKVAQLRARGLSLSQIAAGTGVPKTTISRWLKLPFVEGEVEKFRAEIQTAHHEANQESANEEAAGFCEDLRAARQRQMKWSEEVQKAGYNLLSKVNAWAEQIDAALKSEELANDSGAKGFRTLFLLKLAPLLPSYARAAADMTRAGSDTEDKIFAIEEISRRLDEWRQIMDANGHHEDN